MNREPSAEICNRLAYNLVRLRAARGLTQRRLGAASGLCKTYISDVEQGNVNISLANLEALASGLDCSIIVLLGRPPAKASAGPTE